MNTGAVDRQARADKLALAVDDYRAARARRSSATSAVLEHIGGMVAEYSDTIVAALKGSEVAK